LNGVNSTPDEIRLVLGGIPIVLQAAHPGLHLILETALKPFIFDSAPDVTLQIHNGPAPIQNLGPTLFDTGGNWSLHRWQGMTLFHAHALGPDLDRPYFIATLDPDQHRGDIYFEEVSGGVYPNVMPALAPPLDEILLVQLLAQGRGLLFHAGGINLDGHGLLFTGASGSGKSTLLNLWKGAQSAVLLSDERISMRKRENYFWIFGTHWRSSASVASPEAVPLEAIFILKHGLTNQAIRLNPSVSVTSLLVRSFPPFWDTDGMAFTLKFLDELVHSIPCYELSLLPDTSAVEYVRWMLSL
jgi:hypothetical protein